MSRLDDTSRRASHGLFYMENAGGHPAAPEEDADAHQPSCFGLEEERGEGWQGSGASGPPVKETKPTL